MGKTFFSSDWHFGHTNVIPLCNRPFADVDEMNETMISNFNDQAGPDDTILCFGDAVMGKLDENLPLVGRINAKVVLYVGNHDRPSRAYQRKGDVPAKIGRAAAQYLQYFNSVYLDSLIHEVELQGKRFAVSHYPYTGDHFDKERYTELRPKRRGLPLLHGHVHELWKFKDDQFNVGVDVNDFKLVTEEEVLDWASTL